MAFTTPIRVLAAALALSTLSFAVGVAGDLSMADPPRSGQSVVLRIPPPLPADAPRAAPLVATAAAEARVTRIAAAATPEAAQPHRPVRGPATIFDFKAAPKPAIYRAAKSKNA